MLQDIRKYQEQQGLLRLSLIHIYMIQATLKDLSPDETKVLVKALTNLCGFFQQKSGESPASK